MTFSEKLKQAMQELHLNQRQVCGMTGKSKGSVSQYCFAGSCLFFTHSVCHSHSLTTMLLVCSPIASPSLSCLLCSVFEVDVLSTDIIIHDGR